MLAFMAADELAPACLMQLWAAVAVLRRPVLRVHDPSMTAGHNNVKPTGERLGREGKRSTRPVFTPSY